MMTRFTREHMRTARDWNSGPGTALFDLALRGCVVDARHGVQLRDEVDACMAYASRQHDLRSLARLRRLRDAIPANTPPTPKGPPGTTVLGHCVIRTPGGVTLAAELQQVVPAPPGLSGLQWAWIDARGGRHAGAVRLGHPERAELQAIVARHGIRRATFDFS